MSFNFVCQIGNVFRDGCYAFHRGGGVWSCKLLLLSGYEPFQPIGTVSNDVSSGFISSGITFVSPLTNLIFYKLFP